MSPQNPFRVKEALISLLAGDIYGSTPIWRSIRILKALYYLVSIGNLGPHGAGVAAPPRQHPRRRGAGIVSAPGESVGRGSSPSLAVAGRVLRRRRRMRRGGAAARAGGRRPGGQAAGRTSRARSASRSGSSASASPAFRFPDYRGSDQTSTYCPAAAVLRLPRPLPARRPRRRARDPLRRPAGRRRREPRRRRCRPRARTTQARRGMPDLAGTFEIGPNFNVELWQSSNRQLQARPAPAACARRSRSSARRARSASRSRPT